jgi:hypothetical protein
MFDIKVLRVVFGAKREEVSQGLGILKREEVHNNNLPLSYYLHKKNTKDQMCKTYSGYGVNE